MSWIIWIIIIALILIGIEIFFLLQLKIPRQPGKEKPDTAESVHAYDKVSKWSIFKYERKILLRELVKYRPAGTLLDVGCGPGYLAAIISIGYPAAEVIGLEINSEMISVAKRNWPAASYRNLKLVEGDAGRVPFPDNSINCAVSSLALHHFPDAPAAFKEIHRVLKPGGHLLIFDLKRNPLRGFYYVMVLGQIFAPKAIRRINGASGSIWSSYTPAEVKLMLAKYSWTSLNIESNFGWMIITGTK